MQSRYAILFLLSVSPACAEQGPSFDCTQAETSAEKIVCADDELARLDRRLLRRYADALAVIRALDAGAEDAEKQFRASQRGWIKGRDECWKAGDPRECVREAYLRREGYLVATWILEDPVNIASWECGENPANEVVTYFFETERPSLRFERGDAVDAGSLVRTASGSRYEGSFGRYIWIKGTEATYREPDPEATDYHCVLRETR